MLDLDSFGDVIRAARERRGLRAIDLAVAMNWSGTAPVYRYERGGPNAPRAMPDTINQLANVLELDYAARMLLLGLAGHLPETESLTLTEEDRLRSLLAPRLAALPHPALAFDYRGRILLTNEVLARELGQSSSISDDWYQRGRTTFDLLWDEQMGMTGWVMDIAAVRRFQMLRFMLGSEMRQHEGWYRDLPERFGGYAGFGEMWCALTSLLKNGTGFPGLLPLTTAPVSVRWLGGDLVDYTVAQQTVPGAGGLVSLLITTPREP